MTSGLPSHSWFLWFGDFSGLFKPFISARPWPMQDHRPKQGRTQQGRGTARHGYAAPRAHKVFFSGVVLTCECAMVQGIPIGMVVSLVWWITA